MAVPPSEILGADGSSQLLSCPWVKASCFVHCQGCDDSGYWQCQHRSLTWRDGDQVWAHPLPPQKQEAGKNQPYSILEKQQQSSCSNAISDNCTAVKGHEGHCFTFKQEKSKDTRKIQGLEKCFILDSKDPSHRFLRNWSVKYHIYDTQIQLLVIGRKMKPRCRGQPSLTCHVTL